MRTMTQRGTAAYPDVTTKAIIETIAEHEDVDPLELTPPLYDVVDMDAVEALLETPTTSVDAGPTEISFTYNGYEVHATSDGEVWISEPVPE